MKRLASVLAVMLCVQFAAFSQGEGVEPMVGNPQLMGKAKRQLKVNPNTFDSTFIYTTDTITLPVFDEFSKSKFQQYNADYGDPGVTSDKVYRLLDAANNPYSTDSFFTLIPRYKYTIDVANNIVTQTALGTVSVKLGDLGTYPVVHQSLDVYRPFDLRDTIDFPNPIDTVWMTNPEIFQDSATQFFAHVTNPNAIWMDDYVYHNYSNAKDPWSLGVATFDGLDEDGFAYAIGTTITNYADYLTSKSIDMSALDAGDSVYLSFIYQREGLCDPPESGDSLILEYYSSGTDQWNRIWSTYGGPVGGFEHVHLRITNAEYFTDAFQFRFKNYGSLAGSLDHFHLDYVDLRAGSGYQDSVIRDFAFCYPVWTLLNEFTSVPWDHYKNNPTGKMSSNVEVVVRNSDNLPVNEQDGSTTINYAGIPETSFVLSENTLNNGDLNYSPWTTYHSFHDLSGGGRFDETKPGRWQEFEVVSQASPQTSNFTQNDTTYTTQRFINYYSYDDGTAEQAYGPIGNQSMLAIKYTPYEADSLIGVMMHFVPTVTDVSQNLFLITVWNDGGGVPGSVLYQDGVFFPRQPQYQYDENVFTTYYFLDTMKVAVNGTFYIGWQQFDAERLGIGLDKNIINNDKTYYSLNQGITWEQSTIPGSVMIRPIFSTEMDVELGIKDKPASEMQVSIYPNPTSGLVRIEVKNGDYSGGEVYSMQGTRVTTFDSDEVDMSSQPSGVYLLRINGSNKMYKIIKL